MRICHVAYAYFPADPRVRREVDALRGAGYDVEVICLRGESEAGVETVPKAVGMLKGWSVKGVPVGGVTRIRASDS